MRQDTHPFPCRPHSSQRSHARSGGMPSAMSLPASSLVERLKEKRAPWPGSSLSAYLRPRAPPLSSSRWQGSGPCRPRPRRRSGRTSLPSGAASRSASFPLPGGSRTNGVARKRACASDCHRATRPQHQDELRGPLRQGPSDHPRNVSDCVGNSWDMPLSRRCLRSEIRIRPVVRR